MEGTVLSVDLQEKMIAQARRKVSESGLKNVSFLQSELGEGDFQQDAFDFAKMGDYVDSRVKEI